MSNYNEYKKVIELLDLANEMSDGHAKRETLMMAAQRLMDEVLGLNYSAGISNKHSLEQLNEPFESEPSSAFRG